MLDLSPAPPATGLLLSGGGARAAYQVGVLEAIADIRKAAGALDQANPFPIICGTSAGAINASALACGADDFDGTVRRIVDVWKNIHAAQVYRADSLSMLRSGATLMTLLSLGWLLAKWRHKTPRSLFNNAPLLDLLGQIVPLQRLPKLVEQGQLRALAVTASSYSSGEHITFFEGHEQLRPWVRSRRRSVRERITYEHLLASSAIPFVFPAGPLQLDGHTEYFGDGSMRQSAPVAAPIHLGATRILVVGVGRMTEPRDELRHNPYPISRRRVGRALQYKQTHTLFVEEQQGTRQTHSKQQVVPEAKKMGCHQQRSNHEQTYTNRHGHPTELSARLSARIC